MSQSRPRPSRRSPVEESPTRDENRGRTKPPSALSPDDIAIIEKIASRPYTDWSSSESFARSEIPEGQTLARNLSFNPSHGCTRTDAEAATFALVAGLAVTGGALRKRRR